MAFIALIIGLGILRLAVSVVEGPVVVPWAQVIYMSLLGTVLCIAGVGALLPDRSQREASVANRAPKSGRRRAFEWAAWCVGILALLVFVVGGVRDRSRAERELAIARGSCVRDSDCPATFCDRGLCAPNMGETPNYGSPCEPSHAPATGNVRGDAAQCGPFVCFKGRCRSCVEHAECQPGIEWTQLCYGASRGLSVCGDHPGDMDP